MLRAETLISSALAVRRLVCSHFSSACRSFPNCPSPRLQPPVAKKIPFTVSAHGRTWSDPYHWMSNTRDPDLVKYLNEEKSYTSAFMGDAIELRKQLEVEMKAHIPSKISTPPERWGPWIYYQRIPEGKEYPVLCRKLGNYNGIAKFFNFVRNFEEEVLLDWNEIAEHYGYVHIGTCRVSPCHRFIAYTVDTSGSETFILKIKDLQTGCVVEASNEGVVNLTWSKDSACLLYTVCDETLRPCRVLCKQVGLDTEDELLFFESDTACCVDISSTKDGRFITINSNSRSSSEVYLIDATNIKSGISLVRKRMLGVQYFVEHHDGFFYILTNAPRLAGQDYEGYYIARCKEESYSPDNWKDIILPGKGFGIRDMDIFDKHMVLFLEKEGLPAICSLEMPLNLGSKVFAEVMDLNPWFFPVPSSICSIVPGSNHDFMSTTFRLVLSSPVMPDLILDYDLTKKNYRAVHQEEGFSLTDARAGSYVDNNGLVISDLISDKESPPLLTSTEWSNLPNAYVCERKEVDSYDGAKVPLTILYSQKAKRGQSPGILHGYGSYGENLDKSWCPDRICLINRGWVIAFADVRGGGDISWHREGARLNKLNSVNDFIACAEYLIKESYVHRKRLTAVGYSAGGLLVGATINMYPELFSAAILKVPFLDICNSMLDPTLPLTTLDYEEFGDPKIKDDFEKMRAYSPYDNITPRACLPPVLVTASFNDTRVGIWEAAKWVARVRDCSCSSCSRFITLKTNMNAGHFGEGGLYRHCEDIAFEYAFLIKMMRMLGDDS